MLGEMLAFGTRVVIAVVYRRRAEIHRPMMLLASLMIMSGSLGRCPYIGDFALMPPCPYSIARVDERFYGDVTTGGLISGW
jgi:hypothetical protein